MKNSFIKLLVLVLVLPMLTACPKQKVQEPVVVDDDVSSSAEAMLSTFMISDIEMIAAYIGQGDFYPEFCSPSPSADPNGFNSFQQFNPEYRVAIFNNIECRDKHKRQGSVYLKYDNSEPNTNYYHNYRFHGQINLSDYRLDGWLINTKDGLPIHLYNELTSPVFNPEVTNLSWTIEGEFEMTHPTDPSKNMTWSGKLTKVLTNTSDPLVYKANRPFPVDWTKAQVAYYGSASGHTSDNQSFELNINSYFPLMRDFSCYPDEIGGIESLQPVKTWKNESHPFIGGVVDFKTGNKYPRVIYCGNENSGNKGSKPCDNKGLVLIKGNTYPVDFY